ncbi:hypothetical protein HPP92_022640, partial [Vanilla planifolia]
NKTCDCALRFITQSLQEALWGIPASTLSASSWLKTDVSCGILTNAWHAYIRFTRNSHGYNGCWPSEDVLAYICINLCEVFRSKRVLELGSGYGLAGLAVAICTEALEVVISDGNPQVVDYLQRSINMNSNAFGDTKVRSMELHWNQEHKHELLNYFDIIIASDCTFFKEFQGCLAQTIKSLLKNSETSEAIFLSPKRGDSLSRFLTKIKDLGLFYELFENYDSKVWNLHQKFLHGDDASWPNYDADHCYPLLVRITLQESKISHTEN